MGGILSAAVLGDIFQPPFDTVVGIKGLKILDLRPADFCATVDEITLGNLGAVSAVRDMDGALVSMMFRVTRSVVCLKLGPVSCISGASLECWKLTFFI